MKVLLLLFLITYTFATKYDRIIPGSTIPGVQNFNLNLFNSIFEIISNVLGLNYLAPQWMLENTKRHQSVVSTKPLLKSYDFIIVGAGSAGCVVANRLSADPRVTVLLIEAGGPENLLTDTPNFYSQVRSTPVDWAYVSEPLKDAALNMEEQRVRIPRGKVIGGSSSINAMVFFRGNPSDYDNWAKLGNTGWSFKEVFPFFLRSERNIDPHILANGFHSNRGEFTVASNVALSLNPMANTTIAAWNELGNPFIDFNGPITVGTNYVQQNILLGQRITAGQAFLEPIASIRKNLQVIDNSLVTKVLFSKEKRAIGVEINRNGQIFTVLANKEVILCAGAIGTPHILLLSGVGAKEKLTPFDIPVVMDLTGVGENLQDHPYIIGQSFTIPSSGPLPNTFDAFNDYIAKQLGPLGFLDQTASNYNSSLNVDYNWPDIQVNSIATTYNINPNQPNLEYGLTLNAWNKMYAPYVGRPAFVLRAVVSRPTSRGWLQLKSNDPYDSPVIQMNFLTAKQDVIIAIDGLRWHYRTAQTKAFKLAEAVMFETLVAGCESLYKLVDDNLFPGFQVPVDEYLECQARSMTTSGFHQTGTCKMGPESDSMAVVDPFLRVYGVSGLRVIDASIMPVIPNANTNAPTIMIAEKGAQFIIDNYGLNNGLLTY